MVIRERISKDGTAIINRINELGLKFNEFSTHEWNPLFTDIFYEETAKQKEEREKAERQGQVRKSG